MTEKEAIEKYNEYLEGHIGNVQEALQLFKSLDIPFVVDNYDELSKICSNHDKSKYEEVEFLPYRKHFYEINDEEKLESEAFEQACRHHIKNNKHHWDYWVNEDNELEIPDEYEYKLYCVERCADWLSMANQHGEGPMDWYNANKNAMIMPDYGFELCEEILSKVPTDFKLSFNGVRGDLDEGFAYDKDNVTQKELDDNHCMFITYGSDGAHKVDFDNIKKLFEYIKQCGGFRGFLGAPWSIMSDYKGGEYYLVRDKYYKGGWKWEDCNGYTVGEYVSREVRRPKNIEESSEYWKTLEPKIEDTDNDRKGVEMYKEKISDGYHRPILINRNNEILDGNHTMTAYQELGIEPKMLYHGERGDFYNAVVDAKGDAEEAINLMIENGTATPINEAVSIQTAGNIILNIVYNDDWSIEKGSTNTEFLIVNKENNETIGKLYFTPPSSISVYISNNKKVISIPNNYDESDLTYDKFMDNCRQIIEDMINKDNVKSPEQIKLDLSDSFKIERGEKGYLVEASMKQLKRKTLSEDPTRAKKSKHVQSKYLGISKYGVLNFETTSETHSGVKWYQEVHFPSFVGFMNIVEQGDEIEAADVQKAMSSDNIKISCFTEDTMVNTSDGVKKIKDIQVGDKVLTHTGKYQEVLQTFENDYDGELIEINGVKSTPNHPYLVKLPDNSVEWKMACEITKDMMLLEVDE